MSIIEKLKEEKGIVNIDTFRELVGEIIDDAIENNLYVSALDNKLSSKYIIETLIMRTYRDENLNEVETNMIKTLARVCCSNLVFDITHPEKHTEMFYLIVFTIILMLVIFMMKKIVLIQILFKN